jgi:hypothetical protein
MFGSDFNMQRALAGAAGGQQGISRYDQNQRYDQALGFRQQQAQQKQAGIDKKQAEDMLLNTVKYVRQLPPDLQSRKLGAVEYWKVLGGNPQHMEQMSQAGFLENLTDQKLDALLASKRSEQVLKGDEVLLGSSGNPIYENRPNEVLADGAQLANGAGGIIANNPKDFAPQQPTATMQEYELAKSQGYQGTIADFIQQNKAAGASRQTINTGEGAYTKGREEVDKAFAPDYLKWKQGGAADTIKQLGQLDEALAVLETRGDVTGKYIGAVPDALKPYVGESGQNSINTKQLVEEVVQRNLREVLGAQFTEKEGDRLISRAYNDKLDEATNAKRVRRLSQQIRLAAEAKQSLAEHFERTGSAMGWSGNIPSMADFESLIDQMDREMGVQGQGALTSAEQAELEALEREFAGR